MKGLKFVQAFGDRSSLEKVSQEDIITAVQLTHDGSLLSIGDHSGRLIIFQRDESSEEYEYLTELQSHVQDFDPLKSTIIEESIKDMFWLRRRDNCFYTITTNRNTIKLWKLAYKQIKKVVKPSAKDLSLPKLQVVEEGLIPALKYSFPNLHNKPINSVSSPLNEQYLLSSDSQNLFIWNLDRPRQAFQVAKVTTHFPDDENTCTVSRFCPESDCLLGYGTTGGQAIIADMRFKSAFLTSQSSQLHQS